MMTTTEREIASVLIEALVDYGAIEHLRDYGKGSFRDWYEDEGLVYAGFSMASGCTKACIWHDDLNDWIIKVGFSNSKIDYAELEYTNYCLAEEEGLGYYFPETVYIGTFGGHRFYAQRECECDEASVSREWYDSLCDRYYDRGEEYDCDTVWSEVEELEDDERVELLFGDEKLIEFLREYKINDLHEGNFGYRGGNMVIIDFSGFRGW